MASKRHRSLTAARPAHDKMAVMYRRRIEATRIVEIDTDIQGSKPRLTRCAVCAELFIAAEINPVCPGCGRTLVRRT